MSWIEDVRIELAGLDVTELALRKFGRAVGAVLVLAGAWIALRRHAAGPGGALAGAGALLVVAGLVQPAVLRPIYRVWMALAFALGWITSRLVLTALFALAVTPVALVARLSGKRFLDLEREPARDSYWVPRPAGRRSDYRKMY